jgi:hypothetical protein
VIVAEHDPLGNAREAGAARHGVAGVPRAPWLVAGGVESGKVIGVRGKPGGGSRSF